MRTFIQIIIKDFRLLIRDRTGLLILFGMPIVLVLIMTLLQDSSLKTLQKEKFDLIIINQDNDIIGNAIISGLNSSNIFNTFSSYEEKTPTIEEAKQLVAKGKFKMGLIIPKNATSNFKIIISKEIGKQITQSQNFDNQNPISNLEIFFDPVIKASFKQALNGTIRQIIANIRTQLLFKSYTTVVEKLNGNANNDTFPTENFNIIETTVGAKLNSKLPNSTEHNIPAWSIFAIFFIVIPLTGNIIADKTNGISVRLKTMPTSYISQMISKIVLYTIIALSQFCILLVIGCQLLPLIGLPKLNYSNIYNIILTTLFIGFAATSYAILIGTIAKTHNQASNFGSISVVIFAAIGGIWVPTFMMSDTMLIISKISPLNWSLTAYSKLFLQNASLIEIKYELLKLFFFSILALALASIYELKKNNY
ncbi:ABC transporter permease [Ancylomarina sp. YFZ004]